MLSTGQKALTPKVKTKNEPVVDVSSAKREEIINEGSNESPTIAVKSHVAENPGSLGLNIANTIDIATADAIEAAVDRKVETKAADDLPSADGNVDPMESPTTSRAVKRDSAAATESDLQAAGQSPVPDQTPLSASSIIATPATISRPGTPVTAASRTPEMSAVRLKTLRITPSMSQKPDVTPVSAVAEKSATLPTAPGKQRSRQPSVSSVSRSRPSTPAVSDNFYSNDVSRASSPRPSIVGSAPDKSKTRNQVRKERKSKAKEAPETSSDGPPTPVERKFEEAPPIVARQTKKKKKTQDRSAVDDESSPAVAAENLEPRMPAAPEPVRVMRQQIDKPVKAAANSEQVNADDLALEVELRKTLGVPNAKKDNKLASNATPKEPYTLNQLLIDSGKTNDPGAFKTLLDEHISNIQTLFLQLLDSKQLEQSSTLFNLPPLTSYRLPPDSRKGTDYLDGNGYTMSSPFGEVYLNSKQKKELQQGSPVRISDSKRPNDLLKRTLITRNGRVYRHLSHEEEERVLELERRREEDERIYGELGTKEMSSADEADFLNIQGGLDELLKHGNRHGISWIMDDTEDVDGDMDEEDDTNYDIGDNGPAELTNLAGGWQPTNPLGAVPASAGIQENAAARQQAPKHSLNLRAMDIEKLQRTIKETQAEMEQARKEMDTVEKKWAKKGKEAAKWRESILKGKAMVGPD